MIKTSERRHSLAESSLLMAQVATNALCQGIKNARVI